MSQLPDSVRQRIEKEAKEHSESPWEEDLPYKYAVQIVGKDRKEQLFILLKAAEERSCKFGGTKEAERAMKLVKALENIRSPILCADTTTMRSHVMDLIDEAISAYMKSEGD